MLRRAAPTGWRVVGGLPWKSIRKLRTRGRVEAELQNVRGLLFEASRARDGRPADVVAFIGDSDGNPKRVASIGAALDAHAQCGAAPTRVIGGCAAPMLEGWLLALRGVHGSERPRTKTHLTAQLANHGCREPTTRAFVALVEAADFAHLPPDARSLRGWFERATAALT
jgi:hypothetical protein